jgi:cystathionine beta-lyase/cystathionine gamma-synthase
VHYPGLESHSEHAIAVRQMRGFGGVLSFEVKADLMGTAAFIDGCRLPYIAPSLGGACQPLGHSQGTNIQDTVTANLIDACRPCRT